MLGNQYTVDWSRYQQASLADSVEHRRARRRSCKQLARRHEHACPTDFELHPRVQRIIDDRRKMAAGELPADWGFAENLAYASACSTRTTSVRLIGQDSRRGTFFHRHAALFNQTQRRRSSCRCRSSRRDARALHRRPIRCSRRRPCSASSTATARRRPIAS